jgi:hypothetical protein
MPQPTGHGFTNPQHQMISCPNGYQIPDTGSHRVQRTIATQDTTLMNVGKTCFNYGRKGHFALQCPNRRQQSTPTQGMSPPPNHNGNSTLIQARQNYAQGRVNQVARTEAQDTLMKVHSSLNRIPF